MDDQRTSKTVGILSYYQRSILVFDHSASELGIYYLKRVMRVIPRMPVLQNLEFVGKRVSFRNRTLRNTIHAVHLHSAELAQAMPVNCSTIGVIVVLDMNDQLITPACFDQRSWICLVEDLTTSLVETVCIDLGNNQFEVEFTAPLL